MKEVRFYILGLVDGVFIGIGGVGVVTAWLVARGRINLKMLDPKYVRDNYIYKPNAPWIRNHFDYSYHGRHYNPFEDHEPEAEAEEPHESYCHECKYFTSPDDEEPCVNCRNAYFHDKGLEDLFEAKED